MISNFLGSAQLNMFRLSQGDFSVLGAKHGDLVSFLERSKNYFTKIGKPLIMIFGVILLIYGAYAMFRAITGRQGQTAGYWWRAALAIVIGGGLLALGWSIMNDLGSSASNTLQHLAD